MIDAELIAGTYVEAEVGTRVHGRTPKSIDGSWIVIQQLDARAVGDHRSDHLVDYLLQFSVYAGGRPEVWPLAFAVREALRDMPGVHDGAVVTGVRFTGMSRIPDPDLAKERVILTVSVFAHPDA